MNGKQEASAVTREAMGGNTVKVMRVAKGFPTAEGAVAASLDRIADRIEHIRETLRLLNDLKEKRQPDEVPTETS